MKKLFVIGETENDHRFLRLRDEAEKINLNILNFHQDLKQLVEKQ